VEFDELSRRVIGCAIEVHRQLGPGLLESTYQQCLARELVLEGVEFKPQHGLPVTYKGLRLECGYRVDLLVENELIVELKSVEQLASVHQAQLLTYMRLASVRIGLLINFNVPALRLGLRRLVL
jgi:GxxExxY protein